MAVQLGPDLWASHASTRKKDKIYAAVFDEAGQQRSSLWRFKVNGRDVYGGGPAMKEHKLSLHGSGICRWADIDASHSESRGGDRAVMKWKRPVDGPGDQPYRAFSVHFPHQALKTPIAPEVEAPLLLRLPMPKPGQMTVMGLYFCGRDPMNLKVSPEMARDYMGARLSDGEWLYIIPSVHDFDSSRLPSLPMGLAPEFVRNPPTAPTPVMMHLYCEPTEDGGASVIELHGLTLIPGTVPSLHTG